MEIRDYVLSEEELRKMENNRKKSSASAPKKKVSYEILFQSSHDFGIRKKTCSKTEELIILLSKRQYYVRSGSEIKKLNTNILRSFLKELEGTLLLPEVCWLTGLDRHQNFCSGLIKTLHEKKLAEYLQKGLLYVYTGEEYQRITDDRECLRLLLPRYESFFYTVFRMQYITNYCNHPDEKYIRFCQKLIGNMAAGYHVSTKEFYRDILFHSKGKKEALILKSLPFFAQMSHFFGMEWLNQAVEIYRNSNLETPFSNIDDLQKLIAAGAGCENSMDYINLEKSPFEAKAFTNYLIRHASSEGYALSVDKFVSNWAEYLWLQRRLFGKIREKYPKHLLSSLNILKYKDALRKEEIDRKMWEESVERMRSYEYADGDYFITYPKTKDDMFQEGSCQRNCVADYTNKVMRGEEMILFMRRKDDPLEPLITVEVFNNGNVGQIFGQFNRSPEKKEMDFVKAWAEEKNLKLPETPCAPHAADTIFDDNDLFGNDDPFGNNSPFGNNGPFGNDGGNPFDDDPFTLPPAAGL